VQAVLEPITMFMLGIICVPCSELCHCSSCWGHRWSSQARCFMPQVWALLARATLSLPDPPP